MVMNAWLSALFFSAVILVGAQTVNPSSYVMENGQGGPAGLLYRDDIYKGSAGDVKLDRSPLAGGLGQLSDSTVGCADDPRKDCGNGSGYEWVGWHDTDPTIEFDFGHR